MVENKESTEKIKLDGPVNNGTLPRKITIRTDGEKIDIDVFESTPLEMCEIARRILKKFAGIYA